MNPIEKELQKATGVKPKPKEKRSAYLDRLSDEADKLDEPDFDKLSKGAQAWVNEASAEADAAKNRGREAEIADFDDGEATDEAEKPEPKAKPSKKAEAEETEDEPETVAAAAEGAGETEEKDDEVATKKGKAAKPKKAAKETKAKAPAKSTKANGAAKAKTAKGEIRPGSKNEKLLNVLSKSGGATLKEMLKATGWKECRSTAKHLTERAGKQWKVIKAEGKDTRYAAV